MPRLSFKLALAMLALTAPIASHAQRFGNDPSFFVPRATASAGVNFIHANAPPGVSAKFFATGMYASGTLDFKPWLALAGEFTYGHANNIGPLGQNLTLTTYTAGPRVIARQSRTSEYGQALIGLAHGGNSYFPTSTGFTTSASSLAFTVGGGLDYELSHRFDLRLIEAQYLHTALPNGANNSQNQLMLGVGLVANFGGHEASRHMHEVANTITHKKPGVVCSASVRTVRRGEPLQLTMLTRQPDNEDLAYAWTSDSEPIQSTSATASIDTAQLAVGRYHATGHVYLVSNTTITASCDIPFRVEDAPKAAIATPAAPIVLPPATVANVTEDNSVRTREFHEHVPDVLFDYDKSNLRLDSAEALAKASTWLVQHPDAHVLIGGSSDERGTTAYNVALGLKRANAVRNALIAAGVKPEQVQVVSYGKSAPVCHQADETCYQRNRRAVFNLAP